MKWLIIAIIVVPALEIWGILRMGAWIGPFATFGLILLTGFVGAYLAKREGRKVWLEVNRQMQMGQPPGRTLLDGLCVLLGGIMLLAPGFLSDLFGFILLFPLTRPFFRNIILGWLERKMRNGGGGITIRRW
ncbi:FxsA family protein [Paenibacillus abyssi]|uniref:Membrane protein FxsA n=1 Tax=Paenibacillus abyssi TaxID=1340531 RepID=A0A917G3G1_9BACL|nr:FxsA family protein [Paenibacillus abyssi]GGG20899.1 membrane protein FxsA [Paenibacillus abyssi]